MLFRSRRDYQDDSPGYIALGQALNHMQTLCRTHGIRLAAVIFPGLYRLDDTYPHHFEHSQIHRLLRREGIPFLDLFSAYRGWEPERLWVTPRDQHPNIEGHRIAAEAIFKFLREHKLLQRRTEE